MQPPFFAMSLEERLVQWPILRGRMARRGTAPRSYSIATLLVHSHTTRAAEPGNIHYVLFFKVTPALRVYPGSR